MFRPELKEPLKRTLNRSIGIKKQSCPLAILRLLFFWIFSGPINDLLGGFKSFDTIVAFRRHYILVNFAWWLLEGYRKRLTGAVLLLFGGGICLSNVFERDGAVCSSGKPGLAGWWLIWGYLLLSRVIATFVVSD